MRPGYTIFCKKCDVIKNYERLVNFIYLKLSIPQYFLRLVILCVAGNCLWTSIKQAMDANQLRLLSSGIMTLCRQFSSYFGIWKLNSNAPVLVFQKRLRRETCKIFSYVQFFYYHKFCWARRGLKRLTIKRMLFELASSIFYYFNN